MKIKVAQAGVVIAASCLPKGNAGNDACGVWGVKGGGRECVRAHVCMCV
jgi:hypothetical protein